MNERIERAKISERITTFLDRMQQLREQGIEAICEFNGVKFNNMSAHSVGEAYKIAKIEHDNNLAQSKIETADDELKERMNELNTTIMSLPEEVSDYSLKDIVSIILHINAIALEDNPKINLTQEWCEKLKRFLTAAGFEAVSEQMKFQNAGWINMNNYAPPAPQGKKTIELPFYSGCAIYVPNELDLEDNEQLKNYVMGNFMSQLQTGKLDIANLELFEMLLNTIKKKKN